MARKLQKLVSDEGLRPRLALIIVSLSIVGMAIVSFLVIIFASDADRPEMARLVFASILPLLGTWVGTVLAFYFARENLEAATNSTIQLARRIEPDTPVAQIMIKRADIVSFDLAANADPEQVALHELQQKMTAAGKHRIPILNASGAVVYVVHDSLIARYAASLGKDPADPNAFTEAVGDLRQNAEYKKAVEAIAVVGPAAVVTDARSAMRAIDGCNDVFVTTAGQRMDPVVGWLTNTDLAGTE
jgi:hypothetical protein